MMSLPMAPCHRARKERMSAWERMLEEEETLCQSSELSGSWSSSERGGVMASALIWMRGAEMFSKEVSRGNRASSLR